MLEWRYGDQIEWRLVVIGLRDDVSAEMQQQFDPAGISRLIFFRNRYGMPFSLQPKARAASTGRGCRAVVAARLLSPGREFRVMRALQLANFTTTLLLDDDEQIRTVLAELPGIEADAIVEGLDDVEVVAAYERDKAEARNARGTAIEAQGKASTSEAGGVRYTAPSIADAVRPHALGELHRLVPSGELRVPVGAGGAGAASGASGAGRCGGADAAATCAATGRADHGDHGNHPKNGRRPECSPHGFSSRVLIALRTVLRAAPASSHVFRITGSPVHQPLRRTRGTSASRPANPGRSEGPSLRGMGFDSCR